jgi:hypothetical protein
MEFLGSVKTPREEERSDSLLILLPVLSACTSSLHVYGKSFAMF